MSFGLIVIHIVAIIVSCLGAACSNIRAVKEAGGSDIRVFIVNGKGYGSLTLFMDAQINGSRKYPICISLV